MKLLVQMMVSNEFRPDPRVLKEALTLSRNGYRVSVLAWDRERSGLPRTELCDGVEVRRVTVPGGRYQSGLWQLFGYALFYMVAFFLVVGKGRRIAVVHAHEVDLLPLGVFLSCLLRRPLVTDLHELYSGRQWGIMPRLMGWVERRFLRFADGALVVNDEQAAFYGPLLRHSVPLEVIPNYPERRHLTAIVTEARPFTVSFYGNVRNKEQLINLLLAAERVREIRVLIAGAGVDAAAMQDAFTKHPVGEYLGPFTYWDQPRLYGQSDVVFAVFPLDRNTEAAFPTKMWEGLICGQPAIVTSGSVAAEMMVSNHAGCSVSGNDIEELCRALEYLRSNYKILSANAVHLSNGHIWERVESQILGLYADLTTGISV